MLSVGNARFLRNRNTGKATKVQDADTVVLDGLLVRLNGVDAPENGTKQVAHSATLAAEDLMVVYPYRPS